MFATDGKAVVLKVNIEEEDDADNTIPLETLLNAPPSSIETTDGVIGSGSLSYLGVQIPQDFTFEWNNELLIILSMVLYVADIAMDVKVACGSFSIDEEYKRNGDADKSPAFTGLSELTVFFIIFPSLIVAWISVRLFLKEKKNLNSKKTQSVVSKAQWTVRIISLFLFISPVERYLEQIWWGRRFRKAQKRGDQVEMHISYAQLSNDDRELKYVRLIEAFLESAPQLVLQIAHFKRRMNLKNEDEGSLSIGISLALSTLSLVISLTSYKEPFKWNQVKCCCCCDCCSNYLPSGKFAALLTANIFGIFSRLVVVVCTINAVNNFQVIGILVLIHFTCASLWLWGETAYHRYKKINDGESIKAPYSLTLIEELCLDAVLALVYFFTFLNTRPKWSRLRYLTYYTLLFVENTAIIIYLLKTGEENPTLDTITDNPIFKVWVVHVVPFFLHIGLLIVYYRIKSA